jgi:hypothetical protein
MLRTTEAFSEEVRASYVEPKTPFWVRREDFSTRMRLGGIVNSGASYGDATKRIERFVNSGVEAT